MTVQIWSEPANAQGADGLDFATEELALQRMFAPSAEVAPGASLPDLTPYIQFAPSSCENLNSACFVDFARKVEFTQSTSSNYGSPGTRFLLTVAVTNSGDMPGTWMLSTKRAGLPELTIAKLIDGRLEILRDRSDPDIAEHLRTYHGIAVPVDLAAGETQYFVLSFKGVHSSGLPLTLTDPADALEQQYFRIAVVTASVASMLVLMLVATLFYLVTAGRHYLWLALAELNHAAFAVHLNGYSIHYFLHDKGIWIYSLGWAIPCVYGLAMVQFTRGLLNTRQNLPRLDRLLNWLAVLLVMTLALIMIAAIASSQWLLDIAGLPVPVSLTIYTFGLPIVGAIAVVRLGRQYVPLLMAWVVMAGFSAYFTIALLDLGFQLPFDAYSYGLVGVIVSLLITLTMVLHMRKVMQDKQESESNLIASLEQRLQLSEDKASALATISDQEQLIHASGHDSKQVLLALNSMIHVADQRGEADPSPVLTDVLRASAKQLEAVITTTMDGAIAGSGWATTLALSRFVLAETLQQLEAIYRPLAQRKGLHLRIDDCGEALMISDRALLVRILSNMLSNAVKFTEHGTVAVGFDRQGEAAVITIQDEGIGMSAALMTQIQTPTSVRAKGNPDAEGTGFGFKASISLLQRIGGTMALSSTLGSGTRVELTIPLLVNQHAAANLSEMFAGKTHSIIDLDTPEIPAEINWDTALAIASDRSAVSRCPSPPPVLLLHPIDQAILHHPAVKSRELAL